MNAYKKQFLYYVLISLQNSQRTLRVFRSTGGKISKILCSD